MGAFWPALSHRRAPGVIMFIEDVDSRTKLASVGLGLTEAEARELRDVLETLLDDQEARHEHVSSADYQTELTVWISDRRAS